MDKFVLLMGQSQELPPEDVLVLLMGMPSRDDLRCSPSTFTTAAATAPGSKGWPAGTSAAMAESLWHWSLLVSRCQPRSKIFQIGQELLTRSLALISNQLRAYSVNADEPSTAMLVALQKKGRLFGTAMTTCEPLGRIFTFQHQAPGTRNPTPGDRTFCCAADEPKC